MVKYKLRELYNSFNSKDERNKIKKEVLIRLGMSERVFWSRLRGEYQDLSGYELLTWASLFNCSVEELYKLPLKAA